MKVLHLVNSLEVGGLETLVVDMCKLQALRGKDAPCIFSLKNASSILTDQAKKLGIPVYSTSSKGKRGVLSALADAIKKERVELIHSHNTAGNIFGVLSGALFGIPVINTKHGNYFFQDDLRNHFVTRLFYLFTSKIVAISRDTQRSLISGYKVSKDKTAVIINGIDVSKFRGSVFWSADGLPGGFPVIAVGRLSPEKDPLTLIKGFEAFSRKVPEATLSVVGDGVLRNALSEYVEKAGFSEKVKFLGTRDDIPSLLLDKAAFLQTSLTEGISLTILEAMASGLPVVVTDVGGNPEIVTDGKDGFLVPAKDPERIAVILEKLYRNRVLGRDISSAARKRVLADFSIIRMVEEYEACYRSCSRRKSGSA